LGDPLESVDRSTPQDTVEGFLRAAHAGHYAVAAHYLWLNHIPKQNQAREGARLARRLRFVLDRKLFYLDLARLNQEAESDPNRHKVQLGSIPLSNVNQPIRLVKVILNDGQSAWVFDEATVKAIDQLYAEYGPPFGEILPEVVFRYAPLGLELWQWAGVVFVLALATLAGLLLEQLVLFILGRIAKIQLLKRYRSVVEAARGPMRLPFFAVVVASGTRLLLLAPGPQRFFDIIVQSLFIISVSWFLLRIIRNSSAQLEELAKMEAQDPVRIRSLRTQLTVLNRVFQIAIYVVSTALLLMQFEFVRSVGVSLLASAGLAGLVVGFAAQKSLSTLLAGIQLSITQPIRIGDTVVVEGENGVIEEITLTYVIVRIWDLRRMVIPMNYFLEKPFQNWSRGSSHILGSVNLQVDLLADIEVFRAELQKILEGEGHPFWDGKVSNIKVTETSERTKTLRILVSSPDPDSNWNLRCLIRERLVNVLRQHPEWLPTTRTESRAREANPTQAPAQAQSNPVGAPNPS
jgi:small-conductance mechanosensitive channel